MKGGDWVVMGPAPYFATCQRCDGTVPHPPLPLEMLEFTRYLKEAAEKHAKCLPKVAPKRIQRKRERGWRMPANARYVGRPGPFGNPYVVGETFTDLKGGVRDAAHAVELYRAVGGPPNYHRPPGIEALRGYDLACWCAIGEPCHADVLLEWANE